MGGATFGNLPGNNAPTPVFGGTNPTGMIPGGYNTKSSFGFPSYNMFGSTQPGGSSSPGMSPGGSGNNFITPEANLGIFGASPQSSSGTGGSGGIQGLNSGFGSGPGAGMTLGDFERAYGNGPGQMLYNIINGGLFNPQVAQAFMNAMQPAYNRGIASVQQSFGAEGARFGSAAALGIGDFSSQFSLNEQQVMADMYMKAQQEQLSLLESMMPTLHQEVVDSQSSSWIGDLLGGLEIAGGIGAMFIPGMQGIGAGLIGGGVSTVAGANKSGSNSGGGGSQGAGIPNIGMPSIGGTGPYNAGSNNSKDWWNMYPESYWQSVSAGSALGGYAPSTGDNSGMLPPV